jgi:hypothetical protein
VYAMQKDFAGKVQAQLNAMLNEVKTGAAP